MNSQVLHWTNFFLITGKWISCLKLILWVNELGNLHTYGLWYYTVCVMFKANSLGTCTGQVTWAFPVDRGINVDMMYTSKWYDIIADNIVIMYANLTVSKSIWRRYKVITNWSFINYPIILPVWTGVLYLVLPRHSIY